MEVNVMPGERVLEVTESERDEILRLHERRTALNELVLTLNSPHLSAEERGALQNGLVEDLARTISLYERWWREIRSRYGLESTAHGLWAIDFQTREISFEPSERPSCGAAVCDGPPHVPGLMAVHHLAKEGGGDESLAVQGTEAGGSGEQSPRGDGRPDAPAVSKGATLEHGL
jgi:CXXX repeat modification system protein